MPIQVAISLHLLPGLLAGGIFLWMGKRLKDSGLPMMYVIHLCFLAAALFELFYLGWLSATYAPNGGVILFNEPLRFKEHGLVIAIALLWAVLSGILMKGRGTDRLKSKLFYWMPEWFLDWEKSAYLEVIRQTKSGNLAQFWLLFCGAGLGFPIVEELYFRGNLLPLMSQLGIWAPVLNIVLFALYHFWTPWHTPVRIILLFPMVFAVWYYQCVMIGIVVHCSLNCIDALSVFLSKGVPSPVGAAEDGSATSY